MLSQDEKIHCSKADGPLSDGKQEFTERAAAFFNALEHATPINENDPFGDLEPDIYKKKKLMKLRSTKISMELKLK